MSRMRKWMNVILFISHDNTDCINTILILRTGKLKLWGCKSLAQGQKLPPNLSVIKASYTLDVCFYISGELGRIRIENRGIEKKSCNILLIKIIFIFLWMRSPTCILLKTVSYLETRSSAEYPVKEQGLLLMISWNLPQACSWEEGNDCIPKHIVTYCGWFQTFSRLGNLKEK